MATTTNYGWTTPDDTALVKDGAAAIRTLGSSVDTTTKNLNPETTLGDIAYRSSTANVKTRLGIGTTGQVLTVAGGVPSWGAAASGALVLVKRSSFSNVADTGTTFDNVFTSTYKAYQVVIEELYAGTSTDDGILDILYSGTAHNEYYGASGGAQVASATFVNIQNNGSGAFTFVTSLGSSTQPTSGIFLFTGVGGASNEAIMSGTAHEAATGITRFCGFNVAANPYTGFKLRSSSTNVTGTVAIYGLAAA